MHGTVLNLTRGRLVPLLGRSRGCEDQGGVLTGSYRLSLHRMGGVHLLTGVSRRMHRLGRRGGHFLLSSAGTLLRGLMGRKSSSFMFRGVKAAVHGMVVSRFRSASHVR